METLERLDDTAEQARCLNILASLSYEDEQLDAAEEAVSCAISQPILPAPQFSLQMRHETEVIQVVVRAGVGAFDVIVCVVESAFVQEQSRQAIMNPKQLVVPAERGGDSESHLEMSRLLPLALGFIYVAKNMMRSFLGPSLREKIEARSEALRAIDAYEKLGAAQDLERCRRILREIEEEMKKPVVSDESTDVGELLILQAQSGLPNPCDRTVHLVTNPVFRLSFQRDTLPSRLKC